MRVVHRPRRVDLFNAVKVGESTSIPDQTTPTEYTISDLFLDRMCTICCACRLPHFAHYLSVQSAGKGMACRTICVVSALWTLALPPPFPKMNKIQLARLLFTHPNEFRSLLQYWLWHEPKRDITALSEHATSGYDRKSMKRCWEFLDQTSRSFSAVIKELARVVRLFLRNSLHGLGNGLDMNTA